MANPSPDFSFDLYPGLDAELDAAFERNVTLGTADPGDIAPAGLAAVVQNTLQQQQPESGVLPEFQNSAEQAVAAALTGWRKFDNLGLQPVPADLAELLEQNPNLGERINELYKVKQYLMDRPEQTPEGKNIGDTMGIALIPWRTFQRKSPNLTMWLKSMRVPGQNIQTDDYIHPQLLSAVTSNDQPIYRDPVNPTALMTAKDYVEWQIEQQGEWGVMLVQLGDQAGVDTMIGKSPDELTDNGSSHLNIGDESVDALGIYEWLALSLQQDPSQLSTSDYSWMLANRLQVNGDPYVPRGYWYGSRVRSVLGNASVDIEDWRPRLAVM